MPDNRFIDEDLDWLGEIDPEKEKADMPFSKKERLRIELRAKRILGTLDKASASDRRIFMENCIDQLEADGEDDARDICEMLWEEEGDTSQYE